MKSSSCAEFNTRLLLPSSLLRFFLEGFRLGLLSLYPPDGVLLTLVVSGLIATLIFLKHIGRTVWKEPLRTCLSKFLKSRMLSFTCVHEIVAFWHYCNQRWTLLSTASRNFDGKILSSAIWLLRAFLFCPTRMISLSNLSVQILSFQKKMADAAAKRMSWDLRPSKSLGTWTVCFNDDLISSYDFFWPCSCIKWQMR